MSTIEWTDAKLRGIASDYFPDQAQWPAAMLCMRHLLMEQAKYSAPSPSNGWPYTDAERSLIESATYTIQQSDTSSGCCMCGDSMSTHDNGMHSGHAPCDSGDYYAQGVLKELRKVLATPAAPAEMKEKP